MSQQARIIDYLGDDKFVILLKEEELNGNPSELELTIAHDYVEISHDCSFQMDSDSKGKYPYESKGGAVNWVNSRGSLQIPIRDMIDIVLPYLNSHEYLQKEHLKKSKYFQDDDNFEHYGLTKPRWRKGDEYPGYSYCGSIIKYKDKNNNMMVTFRRKNSDSWETVSEQTFDMIKDTLKLSLNIYDIKIYNSI